MDNRPPHKGQILKKVRGSKGIALETVHEATKIPMDALRAIEEGYTVRTLSSFYHRGFLKIYAQYLKVDINDVIDDYHPEKVPAPVIDKKQDTAPQKLIPVLTPEVKNLIIKVLSGILVLFIVIKGIMFFVHKKSHQAIKTERSGSLSTQKKKTFKTTKLSPSAEKQKTVEQVLVPKASFQKTSAALAVGAKSSSAQKEISRPINLTVRAKKDSWLQVKVDGQVVFRSTLKKGAVETWLAKDHVELSGKNIGDLEFELNGKIIGPLSKENRKAKKVVIDQNGFSVIQ